MYNFRSSRELLTFNIQQYNTTNLQFEKLQFFYNIVYEQMVGASSHLESANYINN